MRPRDDAEALELALIENMAREDLNPVEEARACAALVEELGLTREEVGRRVGRSRVAVSNLLRLLDLPDEALELLERGDAERGPRPGAAARRGPRRAPEPRARGRREEGWSVRTSKTRARESNARRWRRKGAGDGRARPARAPHPDQVQAAQEIAEALGGALGADVRVKPRAPAATARSWSSRRPRRRSSSARAAAPAPRVRRKPPGPVARIGARGRLAQSVRALL